MNINYEKLKVVYSFANTIKYFLQLPGLRFNRPTRVRTGTGCIPGFIAWMKCNHLNFLNIL